MLLARMPAACHHIFNLLNIFARPRWLAIIFLLCAVPTGLGCALLTPLGVPPDELAHIARAEGLRLGQITNPPSPINVPGVLVNSGIFDIILAMELEPYAARGNVPPAILVQTGAVRWGSQNWFCTTQMTMYFPVFYLPAALGLAGGKLAGLSPLFAIYLARVCMLLSFMAMGGAALCLARFGAPLLFVILTLPTSITLGASCSQDGQLIAACALAVALLTRTAPTRTARVAGGAAWWGALALLTAIALAKFSYVALLLFCLAPLHAPGLARRAGLVLLAAVAPLLWLLHIHAMGFAPWPFAAYHPGPLWPGDRSIWLHDARPSNNLQVLLAHPAEIIRLPFRSLAAQWGGMWRKILACVSVDVVLMRPWEYPWLALSLIAAALAAPPGARHWRAWDALLAWLILLSSFMAIELSLYLTFSQAGVNLVSGVQGRYFLLLLPFCALPLSGVLARVKPCPPPGLLCLPAVMMAVLNSYVLPSFLYHFFRMAGP